MPKMITSAHDMAELVLETGFLPLFKNHIPGFSIEEHTPPELWFSDTADGPWEWKGPVIREAGCAYGKFFRGKAVFISADLYPDFANYRRDGYDFDARYEDGLASYQEKLVYDILDAHESLLSKELKRLGDFRKGHRTGFDSIITRLQMQGYVTTADFEYSTDQFGRTYGWGVARYATPEKHFGSDFTDKIYIRTPEASARYVLDYLSAKLPDTSEAQLLKLIK